MIPALPPWRRPALGPPALGLLALLLAGCGGGGDGVAPPLEAQQPAAEQPAPVDPTTADPTIADPATADPEEQSLPGQQSQQAPDDDPPDRPPPPERVAAIVEVHTNDLPDGFDPIPFYADIPGLLRESPDGHLAAIGLRAAVPGFAAGQGFANNQTGELIFVVTIMMESAAAARDAVDYIATRDALQVMQLVEPSDTLFASDRRPDPQLGASAIRYALRYGVEEGGLRTRDVATELVIFAQDGSLLFLQRSVNVTGSEISTAGDDTEVDLLALGGILAQRIANAIASGPPAPDED